MPWLRVAAVATVLSIPTGSFAQSESTTNQAPPLLPAPQVTGAKPPSSRLDPNFRGAGIWLLGAQRSVWHPTDVGISQGYDAILHFAWVGRNGHFTGRRLSTLALGGSSAGFEGRVHSVMALGGGPYTFNNGIAYARLGFELLAAGNSKAHAGLFAPLLEVGHLWANAKYLVDLGLRLDVAVLGNLGVQSSNFRYRQRLDVGGFLSAHYGLALFDLSLGQRHLKFEDIEVLHLEASICGGTYVVLCTRTNDYWLRDIDRHVTELTFTVGFGSVTAGN